VTLAPKVENTLNRLMESIAVVGQYCDVSVDDMIQAVRNSYKNVTIPEPPMADSADLSTADRDRMGSMLSLWRTTPAYVDDDGAPIPIPERGEGVCLEQLYKLAKDPSVEESATASFDDVLRFLEISTSIERTADGLLSKSGYGGVRMSSPAHINGYAMLVYLTEYAGTVAHNLYGGQGGRFMKVSQVERFPADQARVVSRMLNRQGVAFLEQIDSFMEDKRADAEQINANDIRIGVGMYLIEEPLRPSTEPDEGMR